MKTVPLIAALAAFAVPAMGAPYVDVTPAAPTLPTYIEAPAADVGGFFSTSETGKLAPVVDAVLRPVSRPAR